MADDGGCNDCPVCYLHPADITEESGVPLVRCPNLFIRRGPALSVEDRLRAAAIRVAHDTRLDNGFAHALATLLVAAANMDAWSPTRDQVLAVADAYTGWVG